MTNKVSYRDDSPNNFPQDYDRSKVDPRVLLRSKSFQHKTKGVDVRESGYQGMEISSVVATESKEDSKSAKELAEQNDKRIDQSIGELTSDSEVKDARGGFPVLSKREDAQEAAIRAIPAKADVNLPQFSMISTTLKNSSDTVDHTFNSIKALQADAALIVLCNTDGKTDPNVQAQSDERIQTVIDDAKAKGVKIDMLKPHIVVDDNDSFGRWTYDPSDYGKFFTTWTEVLVDYAKLAVKNNIPILCIGCEQTLTTDKQYYLQWGSLVSQIRTAAPDLKLTYAMNDDEYTDPDNHGQICALLDYVGVNCYPSWTKNVDTTTINAEDVYQRWYGDIKEIDYQECIDTLTQTYHIPAIITESGYPQEADVDEGGNSHYQAMWYQNLYQVIKDNDNVIGFAWWFSWWSNGGDNEFIHTASSLNTRGYIENV